jgi:membrane protease YdiL (CAAX protease family)
MMGLRPIGPLPLAHLALFLGFVPWASLRATKAARAPDPAKRLRHYWNVCAELAVFGALSWYVAWRIGLPLWGAPRHAPLAWIAAADLVALFYFGLAPYRRMRIARRDPRAFMTAPGPGQLPWWALVSLLAGVAEELTYRGVASAILLYAGLPAWAVVLVVSAAFGLAHANRGRIHVAATFSIGALLHLLVIASGSLWPAMAAHAVYDFLAGWSYGRMARGLEPSAARP